MVTVICPPRAHSVFITPCRLVAMVSDKRSLNSITKNTPATLGSLLKTHLSMSSSHVVNRNSCMLSPGAGHQACAFPGLPVSPSKAWSLLVPTLLLSWRLAGVLELLEIWEHKSRRQLNSVLQDAALIMEQICSFMSFSSFHLTTWRRLCWVPPPLPFSHHLVSAFNLAFCSASQKSWGTVRAKRAKQLREEWDCQEVSVWHGCCAHS